MNVQRAESEFRDLFRQMKAPLRIPMNKQKGAKKAPAYFTGIINMLIHTYADGVPVDFNPLFVDNRHTRWRSCAHPGAAGGWGLSLAGQPDCSLGDQADLDYTTTFGSRVADAVYESLLDGMEIKELSEHESISISEDYLMVDSHYTWWECGRSIYAAS